MKMYFGASSFITATTLGFNPYSLSGNLSGYASNLKATSFFDHWFLKVIGEILTILFYLQVVILMIRI